MNYLAHAWLSFKEPDILVGNIISDFVKGKKKFEYSLPIQKGIVLHRSIDNFTDSHPATQKAKFFFKPAYRLYSGAFVDVVYDHFLALDTNEFSSENELNEFSQFTYRILQENFAVLPVQFQKMLPHMQSHNWLYNCRFKWGLEKSFGGLAYRAAYLHESVIAFSIFNEHYAELKQYYEDFFPELKEYAKKILLA